MKSIIKFALLVSLAITSSLHAAEPKLPAKEHLKIFILIGQSNMAGRGKLEAQDQQPHDRVLMFNKEDKWAPAVDPLHFDKPSIAGVGLGKTFGLTVSAASPDDTIGLVPCAFGGTSLAQWKPGDKLYSEAVRRGKLALQNGTLAGILWHQGEADMKTAAKVESYPTQFAKMIEQLRSDLGSPEAPVVVGTLGDFLGEPAAQFNLMLATLPQKVPNCRVAQAEGLKHKGDNVHFDSASLREFGRRYAAAWQELQKKP